MRRILGGWAILLVMPLLMGTCLMSHAAEPKLEDKVEGAAGEEKLRATEEVGALLESLAPLRDAAFDRYVELSLIGQAWANQDASLLADTALQMMEGERVLLRPHKGLPAERLFRLSVQLAAEKRDLATLDRLDKAADQSQPEWKPFVRAARQLAQASRGDENAVVLRVDKITLNELEACQDYLRMIASARMRRDPKALERIADHLTTDEDFSELSRNAIIKAINQSKQAIGKEGAKPDPTFEAMEKLASASRGPLDELAKLDPTTSKPKINPLPSTRYARWTISNKSDNTLHVRVMRNESPGRDGSKTYHLEVKPNSTMTLSGHRGGDGPYVLISYWFNATNPLPRKAILVYDNQQYMVTGSRGNLHWKNIGPMGFSFH